MTNAERAEQLQTLAAMARQDGQERAAGMLECAASDVARDDTETARACVALFIWASNTTSSLGAYDYAKLAAEVLS